MISKKQILIVEDEPIISIKQARDLEKTGYRVLQASSGIEAIEMTDSNAEGIDLILMDINLGKGIDGTEAAREILTKHDIPVVFLSSHTEKEIVDKTEEITSYGYVVKNSGITVLTASIKMAFRLHEAYRKIKLKNSEIEAMVEELNATIEEMEAANEELIKSQRDIMNSEIALKKSEEKFAKAFMISPELISINSLDDGRYYDANEAFLKKIGFKKEEVIGHKPMELNVWADAKDRDRLIKELTSAGRLVNFEIPFRLRTGEVRDFIVSSEIIELNQKKYSLNYYKDITERKLFETALQESEKKCHIILDGSNEGILVADLMTHKFSYANQAICSMLGYAREEMMLLSIEKIHPSESLHHVISQFEAQFRGEIRVAESLPCLRKDGTLFFADISSSAITLNGIPSVAGFFTDITERDIMKIKLQNEAAFRQSVIEHAAEGICVCHSVPEFPFVEFTIWNERMNKITGYTMEMINRLGWYQSLYPDPDYCKQAIDRMSKMRDGNDLKGEEWVITTADGENRTILISTSIVSEDSGIPHVLALMNDITDYKRALDTYSESENKYRFLVENMEDVIWLVSPDLVIIYISPADSRMRGYSSKDVIGRSIFEFMTPESAIQVKKEAAKRQEDAKEGKPLNITQYKVEQLCKDGSTIWTEIRSHPNYDTQGRLTGFTGITRNITESIKAEEAILERQTFIEGLIESMQDGLTVFNTKGVRLMVNRALADMTEFSKEELINTPPSKTIWPPEHLSTINDSFNKMLRGELSETEFVFMRKNGERFPVLLTPSYMKDALGNINNFIVSIKDITERKRTDESLQKSVKEKETLMIELQHRVKNNLGIVQSLLSMEMDNLNDENSKAVFQKAVTRIQSMSAIYEQLYNSSSLDMIDLNIYIRELAYQLLETYSIGREGIDLSLNLDEVKLDLKRSIPLGLILNELITNSLKYAYPDNKKGEIRIALEFKGNSIGLSISDDGIGIANGNMAEKSEGMGLQLVEMLTRQIGGELKIIKRKGTTVRITFPITKKL